MDIYRPRAFQRVRTLSATILTLACWLLFYQVSLAQATIPLATNARWINEQVDSAFGMAWGDVDLDGDLDLAVADAFVPNQIYLNHGRTTTGDFDLRPAWSAAEADRTLSLAWGDMDGDGDLDLAVGNGKLQPKDPDQPNRIYRNDGFDSQGNLLMTVAWTAPAVGNTKSVAWGDMDGDGDLDLAVGNEGTANQLYRNEIDSQGNRVFSLVWSAPTSAKTTSVAWGDADGDTDLDLVVGNNGIANVLYRNDGPDQAGSPQFVSAWTSAEQDETTALALADVDGDGRLDLVVANHLQSLRVYHNNGGDVPPDGYFRLAWSSSATLSARSIALGDADQDGDLDLAVGIDAFGASQVYRNDGIGAGNALQLSPVWRAADQDATQSVAWGDMDGDGDLDLATGSGDETNGGAPSRVFRNHGFDQNGNLRLVLAWSSDALDLTRSVAWGDMDGDGDLDLAAGNQGTFNRVYRNENGQLERKASWNSNDTNATYSIVWGDIDGDGDQDLLAGNWDEPIKIYANIAGTLQNQNIATIIDSNAIRSVALGDVDGNGTLDLSVGNWFVTNRIYLNRPPQLLSNETPGMTIYTAGLSSTALAPANGYATTSIRDGELPITYALFHPANQPVRRVSAEYSLNGGGSWQPATATNGVVTSGLATGVFPTPTVTNTHVYTWDVLNSSFFGQSDNVVVRLNAYPDLKPFRYAVPGPYQRPFVSAQTFPFRVRSTQVSVLNNSSGSMQPTANALVYRLPAHQATGALPITDQAQIPYRTDSQGYLQGRSQLAIDDRLVALAPITATESYTLYYMSATPTLSGLAAYTVTASGVQTLTVSSAHPLLLFNLDVALEWDAREDLAFLNQLKFDLRRTSEFLFDATDGQAALGEITLYHNKQNWERADIRIYASNAMIPNADPGGIVSSNRSEVIAANPFIGATTPYSITYQPGHIRIGAVWNRFGEATGTLGEDWPRTLAHELGHYAFYLYDNYLGLKNGVVVPVSTCTGTLMTDQYREDFSEFHAAKDWAKACAQTISAQRSGRSDWETIAHFYPWLKQPVDQPNPGPETLPLAVTQVQSRVAATPTPPLTVNLFDLVDTDGAAQESGLHAQAVLYTSEGRLLDLGHPVLDKLEARGAHVGDRLCVYDQPTKHLGCETITASDLFLTLVTKPNWQPEIVVSPVTSRTVSVLVSNVDAGLTLKGKLYPENSPATVESNFVLSGATYSTTFQLNTGVLAGHIQIWVDEADSADNPRRESLISYALGGSPGKIKKSASGNKSLAITAQTGSKDVTPAIAPDGQVLIYGNVSFTDGEFYALQKANRLPTPPLWTTVVGDGYRVLKSANAPDLVNTSILFRYRGQDVPAGEENFLSLYYWDNKPQSQWRKLSTVLNLAVNEASAQAPGPGLYVLMSSLEVPLHQAGWNLVAYPVQQTRPVVDALASISGTYSLVYGYVVTDTLDPWKLYAPGVPGYVNDLQTLNFGQGYWINATQPSTWSIKGPDQQAVQAANGLPLPPATYYGAVFPTSGFVPVAGLPVQALINGAVCGAGVTQAVGGQIVYTLNVVGDGSANGACAGAGQPITFTIAGTPRGRSLWQNNGVQQVNLGIGSKLYLTEVHR